MLNGYEQKGALDGSDMRIALVRTAWNAQIVDSLNRSALETLTKAGAEADEYVVPGSVELTYAAQRLVDSMEYDAVIVMGCVIKGDTPHFDYVCQSVTHGITSLNIDGQVPVIFGVLTVLDESQALERIGKGREFAATAIEMVRFRRLIEEL